ncbi:unnamed protein product [Rotaria sp. Silwood2]|nr:unnamed protein product [Rotaria sp. Silwood2]
MLFQNKDTDFTTKVLQYQEIFHEETLVFEYSLLKNKLCSFEELQDEAREILNDIIQKYSVQKQHQMSEVDFMAIKSLCEDLREQNIFFKYGLPDPHPTIGTLIMPSSTKEFDKAFMFIRNLPYKMPVSI